MMNDMISKSKVLKWLEMEIESLRKQYNEALKTQSKQKWISCDEKLPKIYENVLIFTGNREEDINLAVDIAFIDRNGHFSNDDCYYNHGEIKYWQPLPELPERKEKLAEKLCKEKTAKMWSKIKSLLRNWKARTSDTLDFFLIKAFSSVTTENIQHWFSACGYY